MHPICRSNLNFYWGACLADTLVRLGLRHAIISPGSRSAPLTTAFALHSGVQTIPVLDERSAAFFALGLIRATGRPVALVCTSGTAAANYLPAVVEAHYAELPLLVITADRPPELQECSAGQAIRQNGLYGDFVRFSRELALPDPKLLPYLRNSLQQAWEICLSEPGPVHLNQPLREPLAPLADPKLNGGLPDLEALSSPAPATSPFRPSPCAEMVQWASQAGGPGLILAGAAQPADPVAYSHQLLALSRSLGWPVLADVLSPVRHHASPDDFCVAAYDAILRRTPKNPALQPQAILQVGPLPTSKVLRQWLGEFPAQLGILSPSRHNLDPLHRPATRWYADPESLGLSPPQSPPPPSALLRAWMTAEQTVGEALAAKLQDGPTWFEGRISALLATALPPQTPVFLASSMPVRDAEYFWPANSKGCLVTANRGANGIDGTLSSALGFAMGYQRPSVLLTGDLAFLHDTNGLLLHPEFTGSLTVVVINNQGGGIFEHLPIADFDPPFERFFATPQTVDLEALAGAHRVPYIKPESIDQLTALLQTLPPQGLRLIELTTDRRQDAAWRKSLLQGKV